MGTDEYDRGPAAHRSAHPSRGFRRLGRPGAPDSLNNHLVAKLGILALVAAVSFFAAWQGSGVVWGAVSAVVIGGGVAVAVFYDHGRRYPGRSTPGA